MKAQCGGNVCPAARFITGTTEWINTKYGNGVCAKKVRISIMRHLLDMRLKYKSNDFPKTGSSCKKENGT